MHPNVPSGSADSGTVPVNVTVTMSPGAAMVLAVTGAARPTMANEDKTKRSAAPSKRDGNRSIGLSEREFLVQRFYGCRPCVLVLRDLHTKGRQSMGNERARARPELQRRDHSRCEGED